MILGEWILTDSIIAYISHSWTTRYTNDIPAAWEKVQKNGKFAWTTVVIAAMSPAAIFHVMTLSMCITGGYEDADEWTIGQCPRAPKNATPTK